MSSKSQEIIGGFQDYLSEIGELPISDAAKDVEKSVRTEQLREMVTGALLDLATDPETPQAKAGEAARLYEKIAPETNINAPNPLEQIANPDIKREFLETYNQTVELFARIGITPPSLEDFARSGVDFEDLAQIMEEDLAKPEKEQLKYQLVFAPSGKIASESNWKELYQNLQDDPVVNGDGRIKNGGVAFDYVTFNEFDEFYDDIPANIVQGTPDELIGAAVLGGRLPQTLDAKNNIWTVRLIPATIQAQKFGQNPTHSENYGNHPTISECLTLQARLLRANEPPIDDIFLNNGSWCWLAGKDGGQAPSGHWDSNDECVHVDWDDATDSDMSTGVRAPAWKSS